MGMVALQTYGGDICIRTAAIRLNVIRYIAKTAAEIISARISRNRSKTGRREFLLERAEFQAIYGRGIREGANFREL